MILNKETLARIFVGGQKPQQKIFEIGGQM